MSGEGALPDAAGLQMRLLAADIWVRDGSILMQCDAVRTIMRTAADAGGATILGEEFVSFPNGAVTGVLVLAQSHLSMHTWPELSLANVDLLTYGTLDASTIIESIARELRCEDMTTTSITRGVRPQSSKRGS